MSTDYSRNLDLILGRRSVRIYAPGEIGPLTVTVLLEAAMAAPSAMTKDPWRFVVVRKPAALAQLAASLPGGKMLATASLAIVVAGDLDAAFERNHSYLLQDCSAAIENLLLAAHGTGLGACWVGVHPSEDAIQRLRELLSLPAGIVPVAVVALGFLGETLEPRTRYHPGYVHYGKWGGGDE
jgi:nitroreductase